MDHIHVARSSKPVAFGSGLDFLRGDRKNTTSDYAVRESTTSVKMYRNWGKNGPALALTSASRSRV